MKEGIYGLPRKGLKGEGPLCHLVAMAKPRYLLVVHANHVSVNGHTVKTVVMYCQYLKARHRWLGFEMHCE